MLSTISYTRISPSLVEVNMHNAEEWLKWLEEQRPKVLDEKTHELAREIAKDKKRSRDALVEIGVITTQPL